MTVVGASPDGIKLIGWGVIPVPLATIAIVLRFLSRSQIKSVGADDYLMLVALVLYYGLYATIVAWVRIGWVGWPQNELNLDQIESFLKTFFVIQVLYGLVGPAIKLSILLLYRRIFLVIRPFVWAVIMVTCLVLIWCVSVEITVIFECIPVGSYWKLTEHRHCIDSQKFYWANGISNLLLDFTILCLPTPVIWRLRMTTKRKVSLTIVFMLGIFVCAASVLRITYLWKINFENVSGTIAIPSIWTSLEPGLGIVAGCLPTLPPLMRKWSSGNEGNRLSIWGSFLLSGSRRWLLSKLARQSKTREYASNSSVDDIQLVPTESWTEYSADSHRFRQEVNVGQGEFESEAGVVKVRREIILSTTETDHN